MPQAEHTYDVIIIGSGIGGLATASFLAQQKNRKVLVLERHSKIGGFTQVFKRKQKFAYNTGVHYLGDLEDGSLYRKAFDKITNVQVQWQKMPFVFEKFVYPDFTFEVKSSFEAYQKDLMSMFPDEKKGIHDYFTCVRLANDWFNRNAGFSTLPDLVEKVATFVSEVSWPSPSRLFSTTQEVIDHHLRDPKLKALLLSQWGDYGLPPAKSAFIIHALIVHHYLQGAWFPVGGSKPIGDAIKKVIEEKQGAVLTKHKVSEILIKKGRAVGVKATIRKDENDPTECEFSFYAPVIVSNAGAYNTYVNLLPAEAAPKYRKGVQQFAQDHPLATCVILYLGLAKDPKSLGFQGENHWIFAGYDHNEHWGASRNLAHKEGKVSMAFLSFPSLKDPQAETHTAEIITFAPYEAFSKWAAQPCKRRDKDYQNLKKSISKKILDFVESKYPGFSSLIEFQELATPLTTEHYTTHPQGAIYGLPCVPARFDREKSPWFGVKTPIKNLYLTGADALSPGVGGSLMSAFFTFAEIEGLLSLAGLMAML